MGCAKRRVDTVADWPCRVVETIRAPGTANPALAVLRDPEIRTGLTAREIQQVAQYLRFALYDLDESYVYPRAFVAPVQMEKASRMVRCARAILFGVSVDAAASQKP